MKKRILAAGMAVLMMLCGCNAVKQNEEDENNISENVQTSGSVGLNWQITETKLPAVVKPDNMPREAWMREILYGMAGETIYYLGSITEREENGDAYDIGYVVEKMEYPYEKWDICMYKGLEDWVEGESCTVWQFSWSASLLEDGTLCMLLDGAESIRLCRWKDGEYSISEPLSESGRGIGAVSLADIQETDDMLVDKEGNIYFANMDAGHKNLSGQKAGTVLCLQENTFMSPEYSTDDTVLRDFFIYAFGSTPEGEFFIQDFENGQILLMNDTVTMEEGDKAVWETQNSGYLCSREGIWRFETDTGLVQKAVYLGDYGYMIDKILDCRMGEDGKLRLLVSEDGDHLLLELDGSANLEKTTIELAVSIPNDVLKQAVTRFNRRNREYVVELRTAGDGETRDDFCTRIQAELTSGAGPDLLADNVIADMEAMIRKKQFMELTEFFTEEDMLSNVWECGKMEGDLYAVPYTYSIQTLVTSREMVGDRTGWTAEELVQCVRESGVKQFSSSFGGDTLFWHLCGGDGIDTDIMDWENGNCHFDSSQAEELLEFAGEYHGEIDYIMDGIKVLEGENFARWGLMFSPTGFHSQICIYQDGQVYIGYPTADGGSGHILDPDMVALNPLTEHRDGAVAFLQYLVSEDMQEYMAEKLCAPGYGISFPVRRSALEHLYEYLLNVPPEDEETADEEVIYYEYGIGTMIGDYEFPSLPFTEENVGQMRTVIETAAPRRAGSLDVYDIIYEETESFFAGDKSAAEVLSVLQNRVQLYLDERN